MTKGVDEKHVLGARVPQETFTKLSELARARGTSVSAQVNQALALYLSADGQRQAMPRKKKAR